MKFKCKFSIFLILAMLIIFPCNALADELSSQFGGNTPLVVPVGHTTESVFALSTDAHIAGSVKDMVLVINGDIYLEPSAQTDLVIDLGGQVINPSNVPVRTGIFRLSLTSNFINELFLGFILILGLWFVRLVLVIVVIVMLTGLGFLFRNRMQQSEGLLATSALRVLAIGIAASLIALGIILILSLTVIGIPFAILMLLVATLATILGISPVLGYIGKKAFSVKLLEYPALSQWFIVSLIFVSLVSLPLVGIIVLLSAVFTGLGVSTVNGWGYLKERKHRA
ncbi:hypothetical protein [Desulfosporosinus sp. SB140]|uniref:hypothetical protein n=1 Tax=Desulfosporosinus paludis TaxID=3115649 RepID=UPI00388F365F